MNRNRNWFGQWGGFLAGVCIGLVIVAPAFAEPFGGSAPAGEVDLTRVLGAGALIVAVLVSGAISAINGARRARSPATAVRRIEPRSDR